jgi:soluble lytic murein transglycosylase-like protein
MNSNKIYISILIILLVASAMLTMSIVELSAEKKANLETISLLNHTVKQQQADITGFKAENEKNAQQITFFRYQEKVFQSKYPRFVDVAKIVYRKAKDYKFSPYLIMALIQVESNFEPFAVSSVGAYGLMQINHSVWKDELNIDFSRIFEKEYNIDLGLQVLKHYYDKNSGNMFMALYRYNNGYKFNNTKYTGKIYATKFFSHEKANNKKSSKKKDLSI